MVWASFAILAGLQFATKEGKLIAGHSIMQLPKFWKGSSTTWQWIFGVWEFWLTNLWLVRPLSTTLVGSRQWKRYWMYSTFYLGIINCNLISTDHDQKCNFLHRKSYSQKSLRKNDSWERPKASIFITALVNIGKW